MSQAWDDIQAHTDLCAMTVLVQTVMLRYSLHTVGHDNQANNQTLGSAYSVRCVVHDKLADDGPG